MNIGPSRSSDTRFYLLDSQPAKTMTPTEKSRFSKLSIGIGPVHIPTYLDRPQIVTRTDHHELIINDFHQWAEPLEVNIARVVREVLAANTGAGNTFFYPWRQSDVIDLQIRMEVIQFDADGKGDVTLSVFWRLFDVDLNRLLVEKRSTVVSPSQGSDTAQLVETMSKALVLLSQEIAVAMTTVVSPAS
jgi:uncharacterized lipoprotein YmbA